MRLPDTPPDVDLWTRQPESSGRKLEDDAAWDEDVPLAPPEGKTPAEIEAELGGEREFELPLDEPRAEFRFSLAELFFLVTFASIGAAGSRVLPPAGFACLVGVLAFFWMYFAHSAQVRNRWVQMTGLALVVVYVMAAVEAIVRNFWQS